MTTVADIKASLIKKTTEDHKDIRKRLIVNTLVVTLIFSVALMIVSILTSTSMFLFLVAFIPGIIDTMIFTFLEDRSFKSEIRDLESWSSKNSSKVEEE